MFRGILSSIYLETKNKSNISKIYNELKRFHKNNTFVKILRLTKLSGQEM